MVHRVNDKRSMVVVAAAHCILNQNAKLEGIAGWPGVVKEIVDTIIASGAGILQMACPEMIYEGIGRFDKSIEQYDCPAFRTICEDIAKNTVDQLENYIRWGYRVPVLVAVDGSPSCGYNLAQSAPEWRGLVAETCWKKVRYEKRSGILMESIQREFETREMHIPILGIPEIPELGSIDTVLRELKEILAIPEERR